MLAIFDRIKLILQHYELILKLASKEIKVRYKHPILGFLWALFVPLCIIFIFKVVFSLILKISIRDYPFFIFLTTAVFPWNFFSLSVSNSVMCIQENNSLIKKLYFPREVIPLSIILANLVNFILSFVLMLPLFYLFGLRFNTYILFLPLIIILEFIFTVGISFIFCSLQVYFRDVKYIVEILLLLWFYLTPIFYPLDLILNISNSFFKFYMLNPLTEIITLYRISLLEGYIYSLPEGLNLNFMVFTSIVISLIVFFFGLYSFKKLELRFADLV
ncbi:MAG: ABC transporter permease [Candidatus Omnitrophica bacterium]|nr:ABC transporter permease [Candidatus Omnitrophota bacterium]